MTQGLTLDLDLFLGIRAKGPSSRLRVHKDTLVGRNKDIVAAGPELPFPATGGECSYPGHAPHCPAEGHVISL